MKSLQEVFDEKSTNYSHNLSEMNKNDYKTIVISSHRRSGTHWIIDLIRNNFFQVSKKFENLDRLLPSHGDHLFIADMENFINSSEKKVILKTHMTAMLSPFERNSPEFLFVKSTLEKSRIIYILRDGRDVLISLYYYLKPYREDIQGPFSNFLISMNDFDWAFANLNRIEYWKIHTEGWKKVNNILIVTYEEIIENLSDVLYRISHFLGLNLNPRVTSIPLKKSLIWRALKKAYPQLVRSSTINPRKGKVGDWKNHFSEKDLELYERIINSEIKIIKGGFHE